MHNIPSVKTKIPKTMGSPSFPNKSAKYFAPTPNAPAVNVAKPLFKHLHKVAPEKKQNK